MKRVCFLVLGLLLILSACSSGGTLRDLPKDTASALPESSPQGSETQDAPTAAQAQPEAQEATQKPEETAPQTPSSSGSGQEAAEEENHGGLITLPQSPAIEPEPEPEPGTGALTAQDQRDANIFLSNFSEQWLNGWGFVFFDADDPEDAELLEFAYLWTRINNRSAIGTDGYSQYTVSLEQVNRVITRYMGSGLALSPENGDTYSVSGQIVSYWEGLFYFIAADGESYPWFSVVDEVRDYENDETVLRFTIYELDMRLYFEEGNGSVPSKYYDLTPEEAKALSLAGAAPAITACITGTAVCKRSVSPDTGRRTYTLVRYTVDNMG